MDFINLTLCWLLSYSRTFITESRAPGTFLISNKCFLKWNVMNYYYYSSSSNGLGLCSCTNCWCLLPAVLLYFVCNRLAWTPADLLVLCSMVVISHCTQRALEMRPVQLRNRIFTLVNLSLKMDTNISYGKTLSMFGTTWIVNLSCL